jgi:diacylglycerol O-acyltransferase
MRKKLKLLDSGWLTMETPQTPMHVAGLMLLKLPEDAGPDYMQNMLRWMTESKEVSAPFNRRLAGLLPMNMDASWLTDQDVDMDYHVRHAALPKPGRVRELLALVSRIHAQHMDKNHPLWECYLIEGLEGGRFAIYFKIHHSLVDGVAGMRMVQSRLARSPQDKLPVMWSSEWNDLIKKPARTVAEKKLNPLAAVTDNLKAVGSAAIKLAQMGTTPLDSNVKSIYKAPPTPINKRVSQARRFVAQSWSLDRVRTVAKEYDATINDIVLAMCGGALREYLSTYGATCPKTLWSPTSRCPSARLTQPMTMAMPSVPFRLPWAPTSRAHVAGLKPSRNPHKRPSSA